MARSITQYKIFIASPSDVNEERLLIKEQVDLLNKSFCKNLSITLDVVGWETDVYPEIGDEAQAVINNQIGDDYDIFIGIMWQRFGTPTKNFESGTEEEYNKTLRRSKKSEVKLMFYFKEADISWSNLNLEQLTKVQNFKETLKTDGVLYFPYKTISDFKTMIAKHLMMNLSDLVQNSISSTTTEQNNTSKKEIAKGYLDLLEEFAISNGDLIKIIQQITEAISFIGKMMSKRAKELSNINSEDLTPEEKTSKIKYHLDYEVSADFNQFCTNLDQLTISYKTTFTRTFTVFSDAYTAYATDFIDTDQSSLSEIEELKQFEDSLASSIESCEGMTASIKTLPGLTTKFLQAKNRATNSLNNLLNEFRLSRSIILDIIEKSDNK